MKAVADDNMTGIAETFGRHMSVRTLPGREIRREDLRDADVLLVRSVTRVDRALLEDTPVRFVGSATIGTDHIDTDWLDAAGVRWAAAPGCNADAAAQYTLGMILLACSRLGRSLAGARVGVIGCGNVGRRVVGLVAQLGAEVVACDPPLQAAGTTGLVSLGNALDSDIVTLHVPLTHDGEYPTIDLVGAAALGAIQPGALLVNTSRGRVVNGPLLMSALETGQLQAALDVWPDEPEIDDALLDRTCVATPHVAGYSAAGKYRGTAMVYAAWRALNGLPVPAENSPGAPLHATTVSNDHPDPVTSAVLDTTRVHHDDHALRAAAPVNRKRFDALRRGYHHRPEFAEIAIHNAPAPAIGKLRALGFGTVSGTPAA